MPLSIPKNLAKPREQKDSLGQNDQINVILKDTDFLSCLLETRVSQCYLQKIAFCMCARTVDSLGCSSYKQTKQINADDVTASAEYHVKPLSQWQLAWDRRHCEKDVSFIQPATTGQNTMRKRRRCLVKHHEGWRHYLLITTGTSGKHFSK